MARPPALLMLADGTAFPGEAVGAAGEAAGEVVFNTAITGYQEIITDPSSMGQLVAFTSPHLGNCGTNPDYDESPEALAAGLICAELSEPRGHWLSRKPLGEWMAGRGLCGISGVDTRALALHLRERGSQNGWISSVDSDPASLLEKARSLPAISEKNLAEQAGCRKEYQFSEGLPKTAAVLDLGARRATLRALAAAGFSVRVCPAHTSAESLMEGASAVMIAGGPGDAAPCAAAISTSKKLLGRVPLLGLGLGQLILALALGGRTVKMPFGHRGGNQAVRDMATGRILVSTQNHGFCVEEESLPPSAIITHRHVNDNTVEGLCLPDLHAFSIQHQAGAPSGSHDVPFPFNKLGELVADFERAVKKL